MRLRAFLSRILYIMLSATLLIDFVNGVFPEVHIGILLRIVILLICIVILTKSLSRFKAVIVVAIFLILNLITSAVLSGFDSLQTDISIAMKSLMFYVISTTIISVYEDKPDGVSKVGKIIRNNLIYGPGLIMVSNVLGVGRIAYSFEGMSIGNKGAFLSLNSINIALMVLMIYAVSELISGKRALLWALAILYVGAPMAMLGTKTSLVMIVFIPILFVFINSKKKKTLGIVLLTVISVIIISPFLLKILSSTMKGIFERQKELLSRRDFFTYLFSTRNIRLGIALRYYFNTFSLVDFFPGRGYYAIHSAVAQMQGGKTPIPIEMDWVDILVTYGPAGFVYTYVPAIKAIAMGWKYRKSAPAQKYLWSTIILLLFGSLAGHLFLEAISSTFFALVVAGLVIYSKQEQQRRSVQDTSKMNTALQV